MNSIWLPEAPTLVGEAGAPAWLEGSSQAAAPEVAVGEHSWKAASPEKAALREGEEGTELKQAPGRWMRVLQGRVSDEGRWGGRAGQADGWMSQKWGTGAVNPALKIQGQQQLQESVAAVQAALATRQPHAHTHTCSACSPPAAHPD